MGKVLIMVPDPDRAGVVRLIEQNAFYIGMAPAGDVLEVRQDEDSEIVFYGPRGVAQLTPGATAPLIQQAPIPMDIPVVASDMETTAGE